jgi:hypothetical protein
MQKRKRNKSSYPVIAWANVDDALTQLLPTVPRDSSGYITGHKIIEALRTHHRPVYEAALKTVAVREDTLDQFHGRLGQMISRYPELKKVGKTTSKNLSGNFARCNVYEVLSSF